MAVKKKATRPVVLTENVPKQSKKKNIQDKETTSMKLAFKKAGLDISTLAAIL